MSHPHGDERLQHCVHVNAAQGDRLWPPGGAVNHRQQVPYSKLTHPCWLGEGPPGPRTGGRRGPQGWGSSTHQSAPRGSPWPCSRPHTACSTPLRQSQPWPCKPVADQACSGMYPNLASSLASSCWNWTATRSLRSPGRRCRKTVFKSLLGSSSGGRQASMTLSALWAFGCQAQLPTRCWCTGPSHWG